MNKIFFYLLSFLCISNSFSQDITGEWNGAINVMGQELPIVFHIEKSDTGFSSKMDSPKQMAFGIAMAETIFQNDSLFIESGMGFTYKGLLTSEKGFDGEFFQNGQTFPLTLGREKIEITAPLRPQEPQKPYPYESEEVIFRNEKAGINLAGTLTLPKGNGKFPAVVLISGSGPQNRNEELLGHKPFLVLSDFLTRNGIAVLRYDDRGVGKSGGEFLHSTSQDFATDAKAAVDYLMTRREIDNHQIGLIGHSEGGLIAPIVALNSDEVDFIILLAGPGIPGDELLLTQIHLIGKDSGMTDTELNEAEIMYQHIYEMVSNSTSKDSLEMDLTTYFKENLPELTEEQVKAQIGSLTRNLAWWKFLLNYDPRPTLQKISVPVLAINGGNDLQVSPEINIQAISEALKKGGNTQVTAKIIPGLNHLFQESETGSPAEYGTIEQTFSPKAMELILKWIQEQIN